MKSISYTTIILLTLVLSFSLSSGFAQGSYFDTFIPQNGPFETNANYNNNHNTAPEANAKEVISVNYSKNKGSNDQNGK